jgi:hypothetical protein
MKKNTAAAIATNWITSVRNAPSCNTERWIVNVRLRKSGLPMIAAMIGRLALDPCRVDGAAVRVVLLADWMTVHRVRVPRQSPATVDVAVVSPKPEIEAPDEGGDERDVGERPAHEVVATVHRPVQYMVEACHEHGRRLLLGPDAEP